MPGEAGSARTDGRVAPTLVLAMWVLTAETVAMGALVAFLVYEWITEPADTKFGAFAVTLYAAVIGLIFGALTWALRRRKAWARGPAIVLNMLLLPIGYSMTASPLAWLGVLLIAVGLGGAGILLAPATRAALLSR